MGFKFTALIAFVALFFCSVPHAHSQEKESYEYVNQWADFKSISVAYSPPEETSPVVFEHTKNDVEKLYRITVSGQVDMQAVRMTGFSSYKSEKIPEEADCSLDLGDTSSFLEGQIVRALYLLGRANFDGPDSVEGRIEVDLTVEKLMEKVSVFSGAAAMRIPGPWKLQGALEKTAEGVIAFDFVQIVPGWKDTRVKGVWFADEKWQLPPDDINLSDWKVCKWRSVEDTDAQSPVSTFGEMRHVSASLRK